MDMPLQHAHPDVLRAMRRPSNGERYLEIIDEFRGAFPGVTMRSTFIVGFPGETDEHVAYLEAFIGTRAARPRRILQYSREDGTPGATLADQVPEREKRRRLVRLREAQRIASERARARAPARHDGARAGRRAPPVAAHRSARGRARRTSDVWVGRSMGEAPGVDGGIFFAEAVEVGAFVDVRLDGYGAFDFYGRRIPVFARERRPRSTLIPIDEASEGGFGLRVEVRTRAAPDQL